MTKILVSFFAIIILFFHLNPVSDNELTYNDLLQFQQALLFNKKSVVPDSTGNNLIAWEYRLVKQFAKND